MENRKNIKFPNLKANSTNGSKIIRQQSGNKMAPPIMKNAGQPNINRSNPPISRNGSQPIKNGPPTARNSSQLIKKGPPIARNGLQPIIKNNANPVVNGTISPIARNNSQPNKLILPFMKKTQSNISRKVAKIEELVNYSYHQKQAKNKKIMLASLGLGVILLGIGITIPAVFLTGNKVSPIKSGIDIEWTDKEVVNNKILEILNNKEFANVVEMEKELNLKAHRDELLKYVSQSEILDLKEIKLTALEIPVQNEIREYEVDFNFGLKSSVINEYEIVTDKVEEIVINPEVILKPTDMIEGNYNILKKNISDLTYVIDLDNYDNIDLIKEDINQILLANKNQLVKHFENDNYIDKIVATSLTPMDEDLRWTMDLKLVPKGGYDFEEERKNITINDILIQKSVDASLKNRDNLIEEINNLNYVLNINEYNNTNLVQMEIENLINQNHELFSNHFNNKDHIERFEVDNVRNPIDVIWAFDLKVIPKPGIVISQENSLIQIENVSIKQMVEINANHKNLENEIKNLFKANPINYGDYWNNELVLSKFGELLQSQETDLLKNFSNTEYITGIEIVKGSITNNSYWNIELKVNSIKNVVFPEKDSLIKINGILVKKLAGFKLTKETFNDLMTSFKMETSSNLSTFNYLNNKKVALETAIINSLKIVDLETNQLITDLKDASGFGQDFRVITRIEELDKIEGGNASKYSANYYINISLQYGNQENNNEYEFKNQEWKIFIGRISTSVNSGQSYFDWDSSGNYDEFDQLIK